MPAATRNAPGADLDRAKKRLIRLRRQRRAIANAVSEKRDREAQRVERQQQRRRAP